MKKILALLLPLFAGSTLFAQQLLNGSFETTKAVACSFNKNNQDINALLDHCFAFGTGQEIDLQNKSCGYDAAVQGNWFISLGTSDIGQGDGIALALTEPLAEGKTYTITFFERADVSYVATTDELQVGLATAAGAPSTIVASLVPDIRQAGFWQQKTITFTASVGARYITFANKGAQLGWTCIDNVQLTPALPVGETAGSTAFSVYPNPAKDKMHVASAGAETVTIYDLTGRVVWNRVYHHESDIEVPTRHLMAGTYQLLVSAANGKVYTSRFAKE